MIRRVVLIHGIWNAPSWLAPMAARFRGEGFETEVFGYASVRGGPEQAVPRLIEYLQAHPADALVGHSLGGLMALEALRQAPQLPVQRVVCMGSPLRGSGTARRLSGYVWGAPLLGRSAGLLAEGLGDWQGSAQVGVIAGNVPRGMGRLINPMREASDGTVAVTETHLSGLTDHCCVHCSHTGLAFSALAVSQAASFLRNGRFSHAGA